MKVSALRKIAEAVLRLADEEDAGHPIAAGDVRLAVRQLLAQAEMMEEGLL